MRGFLILALLVVTIGLPTSDYAHADELISSWRNLVEEDFESGEMSQLIQSFSSDTPTIVEEGSQTYLSLRNENEVGAIGIGLGTHGLDYQFEARLHLDANNDDGWFVLSVQPNDGRNCVRYQSLIQPDMPVRSSLYYPQVLGSCSTVSTTDGPSDMIIQAGQWFDWRMEIAGDTVRVFINGDVIHTFDRDRSEYRYFLIQYLGAVGVDNLIIRERVAEIAYTPPPPSEWASRLNAYVGVRLRLPADFVRGSSQAAAYHNGATSVTIEGFTWRDQAYPIEEACFVLQPSTYPGGAVTEVGDDYCIFAPMPGLEWAYDDIAVIIPPAEAVGQMVGGTPLGEFMIIQANRPIITEIARSIEFPATPSAVEYLESALWEFENIYVYLDRADWSAISAEARAMVGADSTTEDALEALWYVVDQYAAAGDDHISLISAEFSEERQENERLGRGWDAIETDEGLLIYIVYPDSPAERAGIQAGDTIVRINGLTIDEAFAGYEADTFDPSGDLTLAFQRPGQPELIEQVILEESYSTYLPVTGRWLTGGIGYLETFSITSSAPNEDKWLYVTSAHNQIAEIDAEGVCGWIVDVRRNAGGDAIVLPLAFAPLLGDGRLFGFLEASSNEVDWYDYHDGVVDLGAQISGQTQMRYNYFPYVVEHINMPVAVLVSNFTASGGEYTAQIFLTRPDATTRIFGETTAGNLADSVEPLTLWDGSVFYITDATSVGIDGRPFPEQILPDVEMNIEWTTYGTDDDPMIQAAQMWLTEQPECQ
ncbi:MAG: PDZ domain-containing protein [Anaerolineae bacterium]|nr:PDZ domain-containing protein [Anaerolineae bacterium]